MNRVWIGVGGLASLIGCVDDGAYDVAAGERGRPVVYVDAGARPGGDGRSPGKAFQTVEEGVTQACIVGGNPVVDIAPGIYGALTDDTSRDEIGILVACPMTIHGQTGLDQADGKPTGYDDSDDGFTAIRVAISATNANVFNVISSDVTIEGLVVEGGYGGVLLTALISIGGYAQPPGGNPNCPSGSLSNVQVRDMALLGAGQGLYSYNSNTTVTGVYATENLIGFTLFGGHEVSDVHSAVWGNTLSGNAYYGGCVFPTAAGFVPACPPSTTDGSPTSNDVVIADNDFTSNGFTLPTGIPGNIGGSGLRIIALGAGQPDAPGRIDVLSVGNDYSDNRSYGIASDMPVFQSPIRLTHTLEHDIVSLFDNVEGNGRNDAFIGFRIINAALAVPYTQGTVYAMNSRADFTSWPDEYTYDYEYVESVGGTPLGNVATANGVTLTTFQITPGL